MTDHPGRVVRRRVNDDEGRAKARRELRRAAISPASSLTDGGSNRSPGIGIAVVEGPQEGDDRVFLAIGEPEVSRLIDFAMAT